MANRECDRNLQPWQSAHGQSFYEAFTDWLLQLNVRSYSEPQRRMIWHNTIGLTQATRSKWHFPALPYVMETDENAARLLPTFSYDFAKRGGCWVFYNLRFRATWKCDPETGNIVVPTLSAWSDIMDTLSHYRQARGWPILRSPSYECLCDKDMCTLHFAGQAAIDSQPQVSGSSPSQSVASSNLASPDPDSDTLPRRVRFLVSAPDASRVHFLVNLPGSSSDGPSTSPVPPAQRYPQDVAWSVPRLITIISTPAALSSPEVARLNVSTSTARTRTNVISAITGRGVSTATTITTTSTVTTTTRVEVARSVTAYPQAEAATSPLNRTETTTSSQTESESTSASTSTSFHTAPSSASSSTSSSSASSPGHAPGNPYSYDSDPDNYEWPSESETDSESESGSDSEDYDENADTYSTGSWSGRHVSMFNHSLDDGFDVLLG